MATMYSTRICSETYIDYILRVISIYIYTYAIIYICVFFVYFVCKEMLFIVCVFLFTKASLRRRRLLSCAWRTK